MVATMSAKSIVEHVANVREAGLLIASDIHVPTGDPSRMRFISKPHEYLVAGCYPPQHMSRLLADRLIESLYLAQSSRWLLNRLHLDYYPTFFLDLPI
jgi:hypothetical protein